jgi:hypothetical protein
MSEKLEQKVAESLQAAGITSTTEFLFTPVTSVVLVLLDGMTEPLLLKRVERVKGDGGEFVSFYAAKTRYGRTRALNWRTETTLMCLMASMPLRQRQTAHLNCSVRTSVANMSAV